MYVQSAISFSDWFYFVITGTHFGLLVRLCGVRDSRLW